jgi:hypothetical protein
MALQPHYPVWLLPVKTHFLRDHTYLPGSNMTFILNRYHLARHFSAIQNASDAMYCMYLKQFSVHASSVSHSLVNERIDEVRRKLRTAQSAIQLVNPDLAQLEAAIKQRIEAKDNVENATVAFNIAGKNAALSLAQSALDRAEIEPLETELTKCVAAF